MVCIAAALALVVMLIAGRWLRDKGFGPPVAMSTNGAVTLEREIAGRLAHTPPQS